MARALADAGISAVYSYAGRTDKPTAQPLPTRIGGFGGVTGLIAYLRAEQITHVIDATHPFAAQMTTNAVNACLTMGLPLIGLERPPWAVADPQDRWTHVPDIPATVAALPDAPARVFLAIGRQTLDPFAAKPQHHYLLRFVDPCPDLPLQNAVAIIARGPFTVEADLALLQSYQITHLVAKNAGGHGARAKLEAARMLGVPVIMIDRPAVPQRPVVDAVDQVMRWLHTDLGV